MLVSEKEIRKNIRKYLLKEISDEKWKGPAGEEYRKIYNKKEDTRGEGEYFKDKEKGFKYNIQTGLKPTYLNDLKRWWFKNADHDFFNNVEDLKDRKEEVVVIHSLTAYEGEKGLDKDFLKYCEKREKNYKNPNTISKNELSALGFINSEKNDAYNICKEKIGNGTSAGTLDVFLYLNTRKITAAGGGSGDLGTETFKSYAEKDKSGSNKKLLKKKEFLEKIEKFRKSLDLKMGEKERFESFNIGYDEGLFLYNFINSKLGAGNMSNFIKFGNSNYQDLNLEGIFSKENGQYSNIESIKQLIDDYKNITGNESFNVPCSDLIKEKLNVDQNQKVYIKEKSVFILFDLIFFNRADKIPTNAANIFTSEDDDINEKFKNKDIDLNEKLASFITENNNELLEIYKKIWLSCLKTFFKKNIEKLKTKNVYESDIKDAIQKEEANFLERYRNPFSGFHFENVKNTINYKKLKEYLSSISGGDVEISYKDATKQSGTRKYPAVWQYNQQKILSKEDIPRNVLDSNILDKEELKGSKKIDEVIAGNWKINSVWFNIDFNKIEDLDIFEFVTKGEMKNEKQRFMLYNLCFFLSKGFKCFDKNGLEFKGKIKKIVSYSKEDITASAKELIKKLLIKYEKTEIEKEDLTNSLNQIFDRFPSIDLEEKKKIIVSTKNSIKFVPEVWNDLQQMFTDKVSKLNAQLNSKKISKEEYQEKLSQLKKYAQSQGLNSYSLSKLFDNRLRRKRLI